MRFVLVLLLLIGAAAGGGAWYWRMSSRPSVAFQTAEVKRGELRSTIVSTGTVEPQQVIDVGAQVAGRIDSFGKDGDGHPVDYRSPVGANMVLAQIDDAVYKADLNTARAQLDEANSALQKGVADVKQAMAKQKQAAGAWTRAQSLIKTDALSQNDYEMYQANFDSAAADVAVAQAEVAQAQATIAAGQASLDKAQRNLDFCVIRSPVDGVIIDRRVNIGQTVVSSLDAPSLFLIAKDLSRVQVWVAVNEADIDHVRPGQKVTFTCDALQGENFVGLVNKIRLNAAINSNVVTYTVEVDADNTSRRLLPYMTAEVEFELRHDDDVLLLPNSALRWTPSQPTEIVADARSRFKPLEMDENKEPDAAHPAFLKRQKAGPRHASVWVREGSLVRPVDILLTASDNLNSEVVGGELKEGSEVVIGDAVDLGSAGEERDPFVPKVPHH